MTEAERQLLIDNTNMILHITKSDTLTPGAIEQLEASLAAVMAEGASSLHRDPDLDQG